ncbi:unnamed protein product [Ilex paraguariensis]
MAGGKLHWLVKKLTKKNGDGYVILKEINGKERVRSGFFPVYVGEESKRYEIPVTWMSSIRLMALFLQFQDEIIQAAAEPITLPCSTKEFETVLSLVKAEKIKR